MILLITDTRNETANAVAAALQGMGARWARFNRDAFPEQVRLSLDPAGPGGCLVDEDGCRTGLEALRAAWVWHPGPFGIAPGLPPGQSGFLAQACRHAFRSLQALLEERCFMVNPGSREDRANDKGLQLRLARRLGLQVPETLVTNCPEAARAFCARFPEVVFKALNPPQFQDDGEVFWSSTQLLSAEDLQALEGLRHGPGIFQNRVAKRFDLRVTLVGGRVFPVAIHSQADPESAVDFRRAWAHGIRLRHEVHDLDPRVRDRCLELARELGLAYCAMDLALTPAGECVFLEVNPSGQFGWIEQETGLPITWTLAELLARGNL